MLQTKFAKLRKKKKQVAALRNQASGKTDTDSKMAKATSFTKKSHITGDAKEVAKKLIRSGTINIQVTERPISLYCNIH